MKIAKKNKARKFVHAGIEGLGYHSESFPMISCARITVSGRHGRMKNRRSNRLYFVISGSGEFIVSGKRLDAKAEDVVMIPKNTPYDCKGKMKLLLVDSPMFNRKDDVELE